MLDQPDAPLERSIGQCRPLSSTVTLVSATAVVAAIFAKGGLRRFERLARRGPDVDLEDGLLGHHVRAGPAAR